MEVCEIIEGRITDEPTRGGVQMPHDLSKDDSYVTCKRTAINREG